MCPGWQADDFGAEAARGARDRPPAAPGRGACAGGRLQGDHRRARRLVRRAHRRGAGPHQRSSRPPCRARAGADRAAAHPRRATTAAAHPRRATTAAAAHPRRATTAAAAHPRRATAAAAHPRRTSATSYGTATAAPSGAAAATAATTPAAGCVPLWGRGGRTRSGRRSVQRALCRHRRQASQGRGTNGADREWGDPGVGSSGGARATAQGAAEGEDGAAKAAVSASLSLPWHMAGETTGL